MLHFSCDLCGRRLEERRFVVRVEAYAAASEESAADHDPDLDHLADLAQSLHDGTAGSLEEAGARAFRFDLCPACHAKFIRDPLGREAIRRLKFSAN